MIDLLNLKDIKSDNSKSQRNLRVFEPFRARLNRMWTKRILNNILRVGDLNIFVNCRITLGKQLGLFIRNRSLSRTIFMWKVFVLWLPIGLYLIGLRIILNSRYYTQLKRTTLFNILLNCITVHKRYLGCCCGSLT
jgi:hypothetical protein